MNDDKKKPFAWVGEVEGQMRKELLGDAERLSGLISDAVAEYYAELVWNRGRGFACDAEGAVPATVAFWKDVPKVLKDEVFLPQARRDLLRLFTMAGFLCAYCGAGPCPHPDVEGPLGKCAGPHAELTRLRGERGVGGPPPSEPSDEALLNAFVAGCNAENELNEAELSPENVRRGVAAAMRKALGL